MIDLLQMLKCMKGIPNAQVEIVFILSLCAANMPHIYFKDNGYRIIC